MDKVYISPVAESIPFNNSENDFASTNVQEAIEEAREGGVGVPRYAVLCAYQGSSDDRWLEFFRDISSEDVPFVVAEDSVLKGASVGVESWDDNNPVEFSIRKNGIEIATLTIIYPNLTAYRSDLSITINAGDTISVKAPAKSGGEGAVNYPIFSLFLQVTEGT